MPRTSLRRFALAATVALTLASSLVAEPLGAGRERVRRPRPQSSSASLLTTVLVHLFGASGGILDPNGTRGR